MATSDLTDSPAATIEALSDLLQHPGWAEFVNHATKTWDDQFNRRVMEAIGTKALSLEHLQLAQSRLQQAAAIKEELRTLLRWPKERLDALLAGQRKDDAVAVQGRRPLGL